MNKLILNTLKDIEVPVYFVKKENDGVKDYVIFNYSKYPKNFCDDEEDISKYLIFMNIFMQGNFMSTKENIIKKMKNAGFRLKNIPNVYFEKDLEVYNQAIEFEIIIESEEKNE